MAAGLKRSFATERRSGVRSEREVTVRHRPYTSSAQRPAPDWSLSTTRNMSHTGLLFISQTPYRKGDVIELQVTLSGLIDIYKGTAEVVRVTPFNGNSYHVAVHYVDPKERVRRAKSHYSK